MLVKCALVTLGACAAMGPAFGQALAGTLPGHTPTTVVVDFDEIQGQAPPFLEGTQVQRGALIDTRYLPLGVLFDAPGGGVFVAAVRSQEGSQPNAAGATAPGPRISYVESSSVTFWKENAPATVRYFSAHTTGPCTFGFYDLNGHRFASASGGDTVTLTGTGLHRVEIEQGPASFFDDVTFDDLRPVLGFTLSPVLPGRAGTTNELRVSGARPGETVLVAIGIDDGAPGARPLATLLRTLSVDADGHATASFDVPAPCAGMRVTARALAGGGDSTQIVRDHLAPAQP